VLKGTLNPTHSLTHSLTHLVGLGQTVWAYIGGSQNFLGTLGPHSLDGVWLIPIKTFLPTCVITAPILVAPVQTIWAYVAGPKNFVDAESCPLEMEGVADSLETHTPLSHVL